MKTTVANICKAILFFGFMLILYIVGIELTSGMLTASNSMENVVGLVVLIVGLSGVPWTVLTTLKMALPNKCNNLDSNNGF